MFALNHKGLTVPDCTLLCAADRIIDETAADAIDAVSETADATQQRMQVRHN
jgi:hypothetical protein